MRGVAFREAFLNVRTSAAAVDSADITLLGYGLDIDVIPGLAYLYIADLCLYGSLDASLIATADLRHRLRLSRDSGGQHHGQHRCQQLYLSQLPYLLVNGSDSPSRKSETVPFCPIGYPSLLSRRSPQWYQPAMNFG
jgi:hypothetical protein